MIESKDILDWCFTIGSLVFGVFGFLYSVYASAMLQLTPEEPVPLPIARYLKYFCHIAVLVLVVLTVVSTITSFQAEAATEVAISVWILVGCFVVLTIFSSILAYKMD